jgi:hypothetical protein
VRVARLEPVFVDARPEVLDQGKVYVSIPFRTSVHLCCCGCGNEVWMPIRPNRWKFTYDGDNVSFSPSVGNWGFPCQSHYWIRAGRVDWAPAWTPLQIADGRARMLEGDRTPATDTEARPNWWKRLLHPRARQRPRT